MTAAAAIVAIVASAVAAGSASAQPKFDYNYPRFGYEGKYPEQTPCSYRLMQTATADHAGRRVKLRYFYSSRCGSYARIDNAPRTCRVQLNRGYPDLLTGTVSESVDKGDSFAYTMIVDNLLSRLSQAFLMCKNGPDGPLVEISSTKPF